MSEFRVKGNNSDENLMIPILNNLPEKYDIILDGVENQLMASGLNALIIKVIHKN